MSESVRVETHFSGGAETPEVEDYRPISPLVIVAGIAGLASFLAIAHPLFWIVPVVAVVLSVWAIVLVSPAHSRYGGRSAALIILCIAALVGTYAPARAISRDHALYTQSRLMAKEWIAQVQQGHLQKAHQFTLAPAVRFAGPGRLADHYSAVPPPTGTDNQMVDPVEMMTPTPAQELALFQLDPVTEKLLEYGQRASIVHVQNKSILAAYGRVDIIQRYRAIDVREGRPDSFDFLLQCTRWEAPGQADWQVGQAKLVK